MTMVISGDSGVTYPNSTTQASAGVVLQVVQSINATQFDTTSTTPVSTGYSATITPKFATSKILMIVTGNAYINTSGYLVLVYPYRNTTSLRSFATVYLGTNGNCPYAFTYLDSPATTSSITYNLYASTSGATASLNGFSGASVITLMEIAG